MFLYVTVYGHVGGWTVVLRPVELYASRDPRAGETYERGFDDMVVVYEVAFLDFVISHLYTSSQFGKNHHLYIFVFDEHGVPFLVMFLIRD